MIPALESFAITEFAVFCRVGACFSLVPGFSTARIPMHIRVLAAAGISVALSPLVYDKVSAVIHSASSPDILPFVAVEIAVGAFIGLLTRLELLALHFATATATAAIGLQSMAGAPMDDADASPALVTLVSMAATLVLLASGLYIEILQALIVSYDRLPAGGDAQLAKSVPELMKVLSDSTVMAARLAGPLAVYAVVVNFAIGLAGKFSPQISLYFASLGIATMGGLLLFYLIAPAWLEVFADSFRGLLSELMS